MNDDPVIEAATLAFPWLATFYGVTMIGALVVCSWLATRKDEDD